MTDVYRRIDALEKREPLGPLADNSEPVRVSEIDLQLRNAVMKRIEKLERANK